MSAPPAGPRRALVLAGGGLKVAFQAGVLQVWLDEAGVEFDLATGSSGGVLNLAMWTQGMSGRRIADAWRAYRPLAAASVDLADLLRGRSLLTQDALRSTVLPRFGLDWHAIRTSPREAAFDLFNFSTQEHEVVEPAKLTEDLLLSATALPLWFPPVRVRSDEYIDAVFATDANLEEAIRRGATELWVVWTVSTAGRWRAGPVHGYFQMIEAMANANLRATLRRIEESNARIARGREGTYPHHVRVRVLAAEVPLHYLVELSGDRFTRAVDLGVRHARKWCAGRGIPTPSVAPTGPDGAGDRRTAVSFRERMDGLVDGPIGGAGVGRRSRMALELEVLVPDPAALRADPDHRARIHGDVVCPALGGRFPLHGTFDILAEEEIGDLRMSYRFEALAPGGRRLRFHGEKFVRHRAPLPMWKDTTTLHLRVCEDGTEIAAGVLRLSPAGFLAQLASMRGHGTSGTQAAWDVARFAGFFLGRLALAGPVAGRVVPRWLAAAVAA